MINIWPFQLVGYHCVETTYRFLEYKLNCILHLLEYLHKCVVQLQLLLHYGKTWSGSSVLFLELHACIFPSSLYFLTLSTRECGFVCHQTLPASKLDLPFSFFRFAYLQLKFIIIFFFYIYRLLLILNCLHVGLIVKLCIWLGVWGCWTNLVNILFM